MLPRLGQAMRRHSRFHGWLVPFALMSLQGRRRMCICAGVSPLSGGSRCSCRGLTSCSSGGHKTELS